MSSSNRRLVNRANRPVASTSNELSAVTSAELPPYQKSERPLNQKAKRDLQALSTYDYDKHHRLLQDGVMYLTNAISDTSEVLEDQKTLLSKLVKKREKDGSEKSDFEIKMERSISQVETKLEDYIVKGEKAVREFIDFEVQNNQRSNILAEVSTGIANAPAPAGRQRTRRERNSSANPGEEEESQEDDEEQLAPAVRPIELFKEARNQQKAAYEAQSLRDRYARSNHYIGLRRAINVAQHGGDDDAPMPPAARWFTQDGPDFLQPQQDNDADDSDDDLVVQSASVNTKCPLSMMDLTEPFSNPNCVHYYQKASLLDYIRTTGTVFSKGGLKQVKCVVPGCDNMISAEICQVDPIVVRKVKKALAQAKRLEEDDEEDDEDAPPGTQRSKPAEIDEDEDDDHDLQRRRKIGAVKTERMSRGVSLAHVTPAHHDVDEDLTGNDQTGGFEDDDEVDEEDTGFAEDDEV